MLVAFRESACSPDGDKALILGAKALALTGLDLILDTDLLKGIKQEFRNQSQ